MKNTTRDEMITKIYEEIADKTLSFGCMYYSYQMEKILDWDEYRFVGRLCIQGKEEDHTKLGEYKVCDDSPYQEGDKEIIGHPVMIGDVLEYALTKGGPRLEDKLLLRIISQRTQARKAIEDQSDECVRFIYSLIADNKKSQ